MKDKKIVIIGDIHGRKDWKLIVADELTKADKIIFVGDYFDSFNIPGDKQLLNFKEIIEIKKLFPEQIVLLFGNHDFHYFFEGERYSGYNKAYSFEFKEELTKAIKDNLIQLVYYSPTNKVLVSHAGVSEDWLELVKCPFSSDHLDTLAQWLNNILLSSPRYLRFVGYDPYGDCVISSPIWIRPYSLNKAGIHINQVVGHTRQKKGITCINNNIWLVDTLEDKPQYLKINNRKFKIKDVRNNIDNNSNNNSSISSR